jgi:hypothetical protein
MIAITVSTNYADILNIIIPQNIRFFEKWYIITDENDEKTIKVIKDHNFNNIEILFYNFYNNNKSFDKGGAIRHVQKNIIPALNYTGNVLLLDSDIYLPDNFSDIMNNTEIKKDILYGTTLRNDFYSYENFKNNKVDYPYPWSQNFHGYFQLYKFNENVLYNESHNCGSCDLEFIRFFKNKINIPNLVVAHLGKNAIHWDTRQNYDDFII